MFTLPLLSFFVVVPSVQGADLVNETITWGDSTWETIRVNSTGHIFVNGTLGTAFGFMLKGTWDPPSESVANLMLDWCENNGLRFMIFIYETNDAVATITSRLAFWIPKLYAHKMFVVLFQVQRTGSKANALDTVQYKNKFEAVIDYMIDNNRKEMVVGFIGADEYLWGLDIITKKNYVVVPQHPLD